VQLVQKTLVRLGGGEVEDRWNKTHCDRCGKKVDQGKGIYADGGFYHQEPCWEEQKKDIIKAYEWDEYKTFREPNITCPYCGYGDSDSWEYSDDGEEIECGRCEMTFECERVVDVTYTTVRKKD